MNNKFAMYNGFLTSELTPERKAQAQRSYKSLSALIARKQRSTAPDSVVEKIGIPHMYAKLKRLGDLIDACDAYERESRERGEAVQ